jgi:predicted metal-binding protein
MSDVSVVLSPSWKTVWLVCKDCRKRSSGPAKLKPKAVMADIKRATKDVRPKPRVVTTSCLGLCPKHAMTIAVAGEGHRTHAASVCAVADVERAMAALRNPALRA